MYSLRLLLLFTCKQGYLQTSKYDQSLSAVETYIPTKFHVNIMAYFLSYGMSNLNKEEEEEEEEKMKNSAHHSPIHL